MKLFKKLICTIFFHDIFVIQELGFSSRKVGCRRCKREFGMNDSVQAFVPWDKDLEEWARLDKQIEDRIKNAS